MIRFHVVNHSLSVGTIQAFGLASSSLLQIGDTERVELYSMFDTPPESVIVGPLAPLESPEGAGQAEGESTNSFGNDNEANSDAAGNADGVSASNGVPDGTSDAGRGKTDRGAAGGAA
ncbi:hypothetical protein [Paenibacillus humicola]|uniref:hypothetical protein n=1 Tax=Paenibacillus humicola TaxID=3110540 RepID=UPI0030843B65